MQLFNGLLNNQLNQSLSDDDYSSLSLPVVAETWDGFLNDINGFHVQREHLFDAIESASSGHDR